MKTLRLLPCALLLLAACNVDFDGNKKVGSGRLATQQRPVAAFTAIEIAGPYDVVVTGQGAQAVEVSGDDNLVGDIETVVQGDTLIVRQVRAQDGYVGVKQVVTPLVVRVTAPALNRIRINGSGDLELDRFDGEKLDLEVSGSGDSRLAGRVAALSVRSAASGDVDARQMQAQRAQAVLTASGDVELGAVTGELTADLSGSGDLLATDVRADRVAATLSGSGGAELRGTARQFTLDLSGSGDLTACDATLENAAIVMRGHGGVCVAGPMRAFKAEVHGSGNLTARGLQADTLRTIQSSNGQIDLSGAARAAELDVSGAGDLEAGRLQAETVTLRAAGPGSVELGPVSGTLDIESSASGSLHAQLAGKLARIVGSGVGGIELKGQVDVLTAQLTGTGSLDARDLLARRADVVVRGQGNATVNVRAKQAGASRVVHVDREGAHEEGAGE